ncbi:hypothetical protein BD413DRAFT_614621 [Trametes elegans]|nr:hypothetical protein BD413DRAFT_614621 [Trametes elegans]
MAWTFEPGTYNLFNSKHGHTMQLDPIGQTNIIGGHFEPGNPYAQWKFDPMSGGFVIQSPLEGEDGKPAYVLFEGGLQDEQSIKSVMFGCLVAGRLLQTNLQQIDETHALFELPSAGSINHICVFLLGTVPFPDGYGATVHFYWPGKGFQLLGMLSNEKPSAIFRLRGTYSAQTTNTHAVFSGAASDTSPSDVTAFVGLSIEPLTQIQQEMSALPSAVAKVNNPVADATLMAERIVKHLFNYVSSFVGGNPISLSPDTLLPMGVIAKWYENFLAKIRNTGIGFLERDE